MKKNIYKYSDLIEALQNSRLSFYLNVSDEFIQYYSTVVYYYPKTIVLTSPKCGTTTLVNPIIEKILPGMFINLGNRNNLNEMDINPVYYPEKMLGGNWGDSPPTHNKFFTTLIKSDISKFYPNIFENFLTDINDMDTKIYLVSRNPYKRWLSSLGTSLTNFMARCRTDKTLRSRNVNNIEEICRDLNIDIFKYLDKKIPIDKYLIEKNYKTVKSNGMCDPVDIFKLLTKIYIEYFEKYDVTLNAAGLSPMEREVSENLFDHHLWLTSENTEYESNLNEYNINVINDGDGVEIIKINELDNILLKQLEYHSDVWNSLSTFYENDVKLGISSFKMNKSEFSGNITMSEVFGTTENLKSINTILQYEFELYSQHYTPVETLTEIKNIYG